LPAFSSADVSSLSLGRAARTSTGDVDGRRDKERFLAWQSSVRCAHLQLLEPSESVRAQSPGRSGSPLDGVTNGKAKAVYTQRVILTSVYYSLALMKDCEAACLQLIPVKSVSTVSRARPCSFTSLSERRSDTDAMGREGPASPGAGHR
jgi:hypothetical protein